MKHFKYLILLLCFVCAFSVFSQEIIKVKKPYVLIDISEDSGYEIGDECLVYHISEGSKDKLVGVVELMAFKDNQCAAKIVKESVTTKIQVGDIITPYKKSDQIQDDKSLETKSTKGTSSASSQYALYRKSQLPSYLSFTAGILSWGISYYYYNEADKASNTYHTLEEHDALVDKTKKYDNISNFCFGLGGGLITYGIINYFVTRRANLKMSKRISFVPVHKRDYVGMGLSINLNNSE